MKPHSTSEPDSEMNHKADYSEFFRWPLQKPEYLQALIKAYESGDWGRYHGQNCQTLVEVISRYFERSFVRLCSSGTIAVEIALKAAGVKVGDEVILSAYDFPGNFRCIESIGAIPVLADIMPGTWSISYDSVVEAYGSKTKAIIVSHLHGDIAPIELISAFAKNKEIKIIEDICQSPGATFNSMKLGTFGDIATLSFGGSKLLSAGRGGAIVMKSEADFQRSKIYSDRGNDAFPLSELQASILLPQFDQLNAVNELRFKAAKLMMERFSHCGQINTLKISATSQPAFFKLPIFLSPSNDQHVNDFNNSKEQLIRVLQAKKIKIDHGFPGFANRSSKRCRKVSDLRETARLAKSTLILHHPCLLSNAVETIADEIIDASKQV